MLESLRALSMPYLMAFRGLPCIENAQLPNVAGFGQHF